MADLTQHRCLNHTAREAVARCPSCTQFFCRECITEHDGVIICAGCLRKQAAAPAARRAKWNLIGRAGLAALGFLACWLWFYAAGQILLALPSDFHEGTMWKVKVPDE
ncbi:MAG: rhomboid family protein [Limisphaerales bacterium]|nr:MAG: rhomboid family protein [Limisphaerales bacterium]KAG0509086.1 MAG: rhomboid family protein [Limisphaerales bacterium]TXT50793.1 MAG: rhomboid family protein [Limisphaerales bacterium]